MFHTRDLRYFVAVAEHLHFTRAAETLYVTQPAMSKQVASLERSLGAALFVRRSWGVSLTPAGDALLPYAREILELGAQAEKSVQQAASSVSELTIGFWLAPGNGLLSEAIGTFTEQHPGVQVQLRRADWFEIGAGVEAARADVGLIWNPRGASIHGLCSHLLAQESALVGLPANHPLADAPFVTTADLADETMFVLPSGAGALAQSARRQALAGQPASRAQHVVTTIDETMEGIANGLGICPLTPSVAAAYLRPGVVVVPMRDIEPVDYLIVWRKDAEHRPELQDLIRELARAWKVVESSFLPLPKRSD